MKTLNMHEAKTHLSRAVEEILRTGEVFLLCRNGVPVAEVRPYRAPADVLAPDAALAVEFHEDPSLPLAPDDWPDAFE